MPDRSLRSSLRSIFETDHLEKKDDKFSYSKYNIEKRKIPIPMRVRDHSTIEFFKSTKVY